MISIALAAVALLAADAEPRTLVDKGKQAFAKQQFVEAADKFKAAADAADGLAALDALRLLAAAYRETGNLAEAEKALKRAIEKAGDPPALKAAAVFEELSGIQRAQGRDDDAASALDNAIKIREANPDSPRTDLARSIAALAMLHQKKGQLVDAAKGLERAIAEWDAAAPGDPQSLPAIEALAAIHREVAAYADAEPLLLRAVRLREAVSGPDSAEMITAVDSLAYVEFGLRKFSEAEPLYKRLLALWELNGGPDHPMVALTLDKMAEFYAFQQRYAEAGERASAALSLRTRMHVGSLNQTGRVLLMQARIVEAEDLYRRTLQIGDLAKAPDDAMDPVLRIYARILRELKRPDEAAALETRVKDALLRKGEREGRRESPVKLPPGKP